jgi:class 3 adenylate cyclase
MSTFSDELTADVSAVVKAAWDKRDGKVVPETDDLRMANDRVVLTAVMLYADLADSTELAMHNQEVAAEVFKCYLRGVTKIIHKNGGEVRSFDGDRVMGVFVGNSKNTSAVTCGLNINWFFRHVLVTEFKSFYCQTLKDQTLNQCVGIDTGIVHVARAGVRDNNDLIWVGRSPNIAAKLSSIREGNYNTLITKAVYDGMLDVARFNGSGQNMWESRTWEAGRAYGAQEVYRSAWWWRP